MEIHGSIPFPVLRDNRIHSGIRAVESARTLAAGRVSQPADPDLVSGGSLSRSSLPLYSRAADRMEAATGVRLGQIFDRRA